MPDLTRREAAAAALIALNNLQPNGIERTELLAAGIPPHRIDALYPQNFTTLCAGVLPHLRQTGVSHLRTQGTQMYDYLSSSTNAFDSLPENLKLLWRQERAVDFDERRLALRRYLNEEMRAMALVDTTMVSVNFTNLLHRGWWMASHRHDLPGHLRANSDLRMAWISNHMLPNLAVQHAA